MYGAIQFRSATYTFRAKKILDNQNIWNMVIRIPQNLAQDGCGYMIKLKKTDLKNGVAVMEREGIPMKMVLQNYDESK